MSLSHFFKVTLLLACNVLFTCNLQAQNTVTFTVQEALNSAVANFQQLKVSQKNITLNKQQKSVFNLNVYPTLSLNATASYIGDVEILDENFSKVMTQDIPHFGNSFTLQATQLIYRGGLLKKHNTAYDLKNDIAELAQRNNEQAAKHIILGLLLDGVKLTQNIEIYNQNIELAQNRLEQAKEAFAKNKISQNQVIRAELLIKNMQQGLVTVQNNKKIVDYNLATLLNYPDNTQFNLLLDQTLNPQTQDQLLEIAYNNHPQLAKNKKEQELVDQNIKITQAAYFPTLAAFGGYNMLRPITTRTPAMDMYSNAWQAGISFSYNIDNIYKTGRKVKVEKIQKQQIAETNQELVQKIKINLNTGYVKYQEAQQQEQLKQESRDLAVNNYEITAQNFLTQKGLLFEIIDASNQKLDTEIQYSNAQINTTYQYYHLIYTTGTL